MINLYDPNKDNPDFFKIISNYIDEIGNTDITVCGDYNCVLNPDLDYYNYKCLNNPKTREEVLDIINTKYLADPFRENFPTQKKKNYMEKKESM